MFTTACTGQNVTKVVFHYTILHKQVQNIIKMREKKTDS